MKYILKIAFLLILSFSVSSQEIEFKNYKTKSKPLQINNAVEAVFVNGADISWLTQMEAAGKKFYNAEGVQSECISLLKGLGINAIRLRVWVNPSNGWCNAADMLVKAKRANDLGMRLLIDFHYSDTWADPGKQTKPAAWTNFSFADLKAAVANHTNEVLTLLKNNNITPEWVQVGNETGNGMLWDTGKASLSPANMANYAGLTTAGYDAVKAVFPDCKVIVHVHNGYDNGLFRWIFDGLKNNGGKWDIVGMSLYPFYYSTPNDWSNANKACLANMNDMVSRYGKEVMIVECGMSWDSPELCYNFLTDLIAKTKSVPNGKGLGVFYWEPQSYGNWQGYTLGAFDNFGKPTLAMNAFKINTDSKKVDIEKISYIWSKFNNELKFSKQIAEFLVYTIDGKIIFKAKNSDSFKLKNLKSGNYIISYVDSESGKGYSNILNLD